jgi:hypothetical protein
VQYRVLSADHLVSSIRSHAIMSLRRIAPRLMRPGFDAAVPGRCKRPQRAAK